ncbi:MAG TPA: hypothetical protein VNR87_02660 [Flavisolibacter sp.]|nr:hypothetical protein [Flavisolibacter sp.]
MKNSKTGSTGGMIVFMSILANAVVVEKGFMERQWYWALLVTLPALVVALKKYGIRSRFGVLRKKDAGATARSSVFSRGTS